jgi:hypothetical protein
MHSKRLQLTTQQLHRHEPGQEGIYIWPDIFQTIFCYCFQFLKWVPCQHGMARPRAADGGDGRQIWKATVNECIE